MRGCLAGWDGDTERTAMWSYAQGTDRVKVISSQIEQMELNALMDGETEAHEVRARGVAPYLPVCLHHV